MECPRCRVSLDEIEMDDFALDRCSRCGAVWFDFMELERTMGMGRAALKALTVPRFYRGEEGLKQEKLYCPRCEAHLVRVRSTLDPDLTLLGCLSCYGRWVERDEIARVKRKTLLTKVRRVVEKIW